MFINTNFHLIKIIILIKFLITLCLLSITAQALEPKSGLICNDLKNTTFLEFYFENNDDEIPEYAFKRVKGKFIKVGNVVGQKTSSFILFEDKYAYLGVDFAWHLDMVTKNLKPIILSESTIKLNKLPQTFDCISKNFWF